VIQLSITLTTEKEMQRIIKAFGTIEFDFEEESSNYSYLGILDVYDRCLDEREACELLSFDIHNLQNEYKFFSFFRFLAEDMFKLSPIFAVIRGYFDFPITNKIGKEIVKTKLKSLEKETDKRLFVDLVNKGLYDWKLIKIDDIESLLFLVKLSTREIIFADFYLLQHSSVILGNYDLSFPIYCNDVESFKYFGGLYIR
jgi:hypothetical protein